MFDWSGKMEIDQGKVREKSCVSDNPVFVSIWKIIRVAQY